MKRGERKARWMMGRIESAGVLAEPVRIPGEGWGLKFPDRPEHTPEQRQVAVDALLFGVAHPRCFATMCRLLRKRSEANV